VGGRVLVERGMDPRELAEENERLRARVAQQERQNRLLAEQVTRLLDEVAKLTKKSKKKGEKAPHHEPTPSSDAAPAPKPPERSKSSSTNGDGGRPRRQPPPDHLERVVQPEPLGTPSCCAFPLLEAREPLVREQKDHVPARVLVRRIELHRAECLCCGTMHTAPMPPVAMPNGSMTAALVAMIVHGKCSLHLPLVRIMGELLAMGLAVAKSTMSNVMRHAAGLLTPIYDRIVAALFASGLVHLDGTGVKTLQPGEKGSHRGQFTVICNSALTAYCYSPDKSAHHVVGFFGVNTKDGYRGDIVADAASTNNGLFVRGRTRECGCWYHARAMFEAAVPGSPTEATEALGWMGTLFDVETAADQARDSAADRLRRRKKQSIHLLRGFHRWMKATQGRCAPEEELAKAIRYCHNHWGALTRFMTDGAIPMTNNLAERELGVIGRGRKAWLFAGSDAGGEWLAVLYTVVRTCERLAVLPYAYLAWVLARLSDVPANRGRGTLAQLTPMAYAQHKGAIA
jgi:transposase